VIAPSCLPLLPIRKPRTVCTGQAYIFCSFMQGVDWVSELRAAGGGDVLSVSEKPEFVIRHESTIHSGGRFLYHRASAGEVSIHAYKRQSASNRAPQRSTSFLLPERCMATTSGSETRRRSLPPRAAWRSTRLRSTTIGRRAARACPRWMARPCDQNRKVLIYFAT
jgi:hypothetical protein